jgi:hypothetical protein
MLEVAYEAVVISAHEVRIRNLTDQVLFLRKALMVLAVFYVVLGAGVSFCLARLLFGA